MVLADWVTAPDTVRALCRWHFNWGVPMWFVKHYCWRRRVFDSGCRNSWPPRICSKHRPFAGFSRLHVGQSKSATWVNSALAPTQRRIPYKLMEKIDPYGKSIFLKIESFPIPTLIARNTNGNQYRKPTTVAKFSFFLDMAATDTKDFRIKV